MNTLWLLGLLAGCVNLVVGGLSQQYYQAPRDLQQQQSADIEQEQSADIEQEQSADIEQVQTADLQQVQTADLEQSADLEQQEQSADLEQQQQQSASPPKLVYAIPQPRPLGPCKACYIRLADGRCTWSRSLCQQRHN